MRIVILTSAAIAAIIATGAVVATQRQPAVRDRSTQLTATTSVSTHMTALAAGAACTGTFDTIALDHVTRLDGARLGQFDTNGAGLAVNDLDDDGRPDIVLANLDGPSTILWNDGDLRFSRQELDDRSARGVATVDVDADGRLDIAMTHRGAGVSLWRNVGGPRATSFERGALPGVMRPAYAMDWADLTGDGALDLVTGSYDADLDKVLGTSFLLSDGAGIFVYEARGGGYVAERLARTSQTLTIATPDLDGDGRRDLVTGNDFTVPDRAWLRAGDAWQPTAPFGRTTENTMSMAEVDVDNDGRMELFATDMKPYHTDTTTLAAWLPVIAKMRDKHPAGDPQRPVNTLQVRGAGGGFSEEAQARGLDATGWSWSSKFGDLDNDGSVDLYVANGMIDADLLGYLPGAELVEQNQALRNQGDGTFVRQPGWQMTSTASGRGMTLADLDADGRLDAVVNNLLTPAQLFHNRICGGDALEVALSAPGSPNPFAIGARLTLWTDRGVYDRQLSATSGYLSGDPSRVHFGFPTGATLDRLEIRWPDGEVAVVDAPPGDSLLAVSRS